MLPVAIQPAAAIVPEVAGLSEAPQLVPVDQAMVRSAETAETATARRIANKMERMRILI